MKSVESLIELFRQNGLKITPQRQAIFERLSRDDSHPTAEEVYQGLLAAMPDISRTTIYNTLRELIELGELNLVENFSDGGVRYDTRPDPHHHLFCMGCHALVDIDLSFGELKLPPEETSGYQVVRGQVTLYGYCSNCRRDRVHNQSV